MSKEEKGEKKPLFDFFVFDDKSSSICQRGLRARCCLNPSSGQTIVWSNCSGGMDAVLEPSAVGCHAGLLSAGRTELWLREGVWSLTWVLISAWATCGDWTGCLASRSPGALGCGRAPGPPRAWRQQVCSGCVQVPASIIVPARGWGGGFAPWEGPWSPSAGPHNFTCSGGRRRGVHGQLCFTSAKKCFTSKLPRGALPGVS